MAQDAHLVVCLHQLEILESGGHRSGIGIVSIDDDGVVGRLFQLRPVVRRHVVGNGLRDVVGRHAEILSDGGGGKRVVNVIGANQVGLDIMVVPLEMQERAAVKQLSLHAETLGLLLAVGDGFQPAGDAFQVWVVVVQEDLATMLAQEVIELAFRLDHTLERAETQQMGLAYVRDDAVVGLNDIHQRLDLAGVVGTHLYDSHLMVCRQLKQRLWHADMVVEIAFCIVGVVFL